MASVTAADCRSCGACCIAPGRQTEFCDLSEFDVDRLPKRFVRLHVVSDSPAARVIAAVSGHVLPYAVIEAHFREQKAGPYAGGDVNVCAALRGSVGHRVSCRVYAKRPEACREAVKPGDWNCLMLRKALFESAET